MSPCLQCSSFQAYWQAPQRVQRPKAGKARKTHRNVARNGDLIYRDFKDYIRNYMGLYGIIWEIEYLCGLWDFMEYPRDKLLQKDVWKMTCKCWGFHTYVSLREGNYTIISIIGSFLGFSHHNFNNTSPQEYYY